MTPLPSGSRYVHSHSMAMTDLSRGTFSGQFAFVWIEPKSNPGRYDQEVFLAKHEWDPYTTSMEERDDISPPPSAPKPPDSNAAQMGLEVRYRHFTLNGKCLGFGDPVRVKPEQCVLFHFLNASATESVRLALPGHRFEVIALDGNPVPHPALADVLELGTAGKPVWAKPPAAAWDYTAFGENGVAPKPDAVIPLIVRRGPRDSKSGFETWTINGKGYDANQQTTLSKGTRYRLVIDKQSDDVHPVHLHRASFELTGISGVSTSGIMKDVVVVKSDQKVQVDVTPQLEGLTLFHCHQQVHMDYGFKMLFNVA